jgi:hypothetical protein
MLVHVRIIQWIVGWNTCQEGEEREGWRERERYGLNGGDETAGGDLNIEEEGGGNKKNRNKKVRFLSDM